ncbi:MAG: cytidine deaminase, partial [Planctomycetota bacterium]|nr:cytidine deaminase [Planctomycetota bacterium]
DKQQLIAASIETLLLGYAPYSSYQVGAAILAADGRVFTGSNVENASYGMTLCAERVAVASAVAAGAREFSALAVATAGGGTPCGACRQVLAEFCEDLPVLLVDVSREQAVAETMLRQLLPDRFRL